MVKQRLDANNLSQVAPGALKAMLALSNYVNNCGLEHALQELVKIRASQINGCANCLHMHTRDARAQGETEERIYLLDAWREAPVYTERERAALAWTEALTLVTEGGVPDEVYEEARKHFTEEELVNLSLLVATINGWNRLNIAFRVVPEVKANTAA
ncbi:MAG TPA: carboxymuconolactone decarboxylase family protein [Blastocatellia bacterium]|nr:carboxymuconolactone decarboxylase family protein [Blastocatellia bacterium]